MKNERRENSPSGGGHDGGFRGGPMGPMGRPVIKAKDFRGTFNRLLG